MTYSPLRFSLLLFFSLVFAIPRLSAQTPPVITGELKKWHKVTLTFNGPTCSETGTPNPFLDYRLLVTFSNGTKVYEVPGYFAADGNAANTGATSGDKWRVHFAPDEVGVWNWTANFTSGSQIAIDLNPDNGTPTSFDGATGSFTISATDKTGRDLRGKGRLNYVGGHHMQFAETGEYFLKGGADSPENLLAYDDFDNTTNIGSYRKSWSPHVADWQTGDPTWKTGLGKGLIGAVNYLSSKGMDGFSFLTMNVNGDDKNVFPYVVNNGGAAPQNDRRQFDCSKLEQWEIVFEHADKKGMHLHFKTQEIENDDLLDGGNLGVERKMYYHELVARFGHHLALNWNLGEEYDAYIILNDPQMLVLKSCAQYFKDLDPYDHNIVVHTYPNQWNTVYTPMLGNNSELTGTSLQVNYNQVHQLTLDWITKSDAANKPWVVANDEQGSANDGLRPDGASSNLDNIRRYVLWGNVMAGGAGVEYYFGYAYPNSDLTCQDWRSREQGWTQTKYALDFFNQYTPFWQMNSQNGLVNNALNANTNYCFAKRGDTYVVYRPSSSPFLNLETFADTFDVMWFNPRTGGALASGTIGTVVGPGNVTIGNPPNTTTSDWVALLRVRKNGPVQLKPVVDITQPLNGSSIAPATNATITATASDPDGTVASVQFLANTTVLQTLTSAPYTYTWTPPAAGVYVIRAIATDNQGLKGRDSVTVTVLANQSPVVQFTQPTNNAQFTSTQTVPLNVTATDADGTVSQVKILQGATTLQTFLSGPYSLVFTPPGPGTYVFTAQATDNTGAISTATVTVTVLPNQAPLLQITQPAAASQIPYNQTIPFQATASDPDGTLSQVQFFVNNTLVQSFSGAPYAYTVVPSGPGTYDLRAVATDNQGLSTTRTVQVTVLPNLPPVVTINQPLLGATYSYFQTVNIDASATDPDGTIDSVWFEINGVQVAAFASGPYTFAWVPLGTGPDTLLVIARDNTGQTGSASRVFTILPNQPPLVSITGPVASSQVTINIPILFKANATDPEGSPVFVSFYAAGVLLGVDSIAPYEINWTPGSLGNKTLIAMGVDSLGQSASDTITVQVVANQPPVIQITAPANNTQSILGQSITLTAVASDPDGSVTKVEFFAGGALIGTVTSAPYTLVWNPVVSGNYSVVATATDDQGETNSAILSISVVSNLSPLVQITQPVTGANFSLTQSVAIAATASDPDGTVANVKFYVNNLLVQTDPTSPYTASWTPTGLGSFKVKAIATDNQGATRADSVQITVVGNQLPVVNITLPLNNASIPLGVATTYTATASDPDGSINRVEFFVNGTLVATEFVSSYSISWIPTTPGPAMLIAKAFDNQGGTRSDTIYITVTNRNPVVAITSPANNTNRTAGLPFSITATASDPDGTVASVAFYQNGVLISTDASTPFSAVWAPSVVGNAKIKAIATDNFGATSADSINLVIVANQKPIVVITQPANNSSLSINQPVAIAATATDPDGTITKVEFFNGATLLFTDTQSPYSYSWSPASPGNYNLIVKATDNALQVGADTAAVSIVANQAPLVQITSPTGLGAFLAGLPITIQASASDADGSVSSVTFLLNGAQGLVDASSPYAYTFTPPSAGSYTVVARASDNLGSQASDTLIIQVAPNFPPTVIITQPASSSQAIPGTPVSVQFTVTDPDANVTQVSLLLNGSLLQTFSQAPYAYNWTPTTPGTYTFIARAVDAGNNTRSDTAVVTVISYQLPIVRFTQPLMRDTILLNVPFQVRMTASSFNSTITQVQLKIGSTIVQTFTQPPYNFTWTPTSPGAYNLVATTRDSFNGTGKDSIRVWAFPNVAPVVDLTSPLPNQSVALGQSVNIQATASDPDGTIAQVQLLNGNTVLQTFTNAGPYSFNWTPSAAGSYLIKARATDNNGAVSTDSALIQVSGLPPVVRFTSPLNGGTIVLNQSNTFQVTATDPDGTIANVKFYVGTTLVQTLTTPPYNFTYTPTSAGAYNFIVRGTDSQGLTGKDSIRVNTIALIPPVVTITQPLAGASLPIGQVVTYAATASDPNGTISQVTFAVNGVIIQTLTAAPYSINWTPATPGITDLVVRARDNQGLFGKDSIRINVTNYLPPVVQFTAPLNGGTVIRNQSNPVTVSASDPDGTITQVRFFNGTTLLQTVTSAPFNFTFTPPALGSYNLIARATDSQGLTARDSIWVTAVNPPLPVVLVKFTTPLNGNSMPVNQPRTLTATATTNTGTVGNVIFYVGNTPIFTDTQAPYTTTFTPPTPGAYNLIVKAWDTQNNYLGKDSIRVTVNGFLPPVVQFTQPLMNGQLVQNQPNSIRVSAADPDGTIANVRFFVGTTLIQTLTAPPYNFVYTPQALGTYVLIARATDSQGLTSRDSIRVTTVASTGLTQVQFVQPSNGNTLPVNQPAVISALATIATGSISQVVFYDGITPIYTDTQAPYTGTWTPTIPGAHNLIVKAFSGATQIGKDSIRITVGGFLPPVVTFTQPLNGGTLANLQPNLIKAIASDPDGTIANVKFYVGTTLLQTVTAPPYQVLYTPTSLGSYNLIVRTTDSQGLTAKDSIRVTSVTNPGIAQVRFAQPVNGGQLPVNQPSLVSALATSANGNVNQVIFYVGTTPVQTLTAPPYSFNWTPPTPGAYSLVVRAWDNVGLIGKDSIRVQVNGYLPPVVSFTYPTNGGSVVVNTPTSVQVSASDPDGTIVNVKFYIGTTLQQTLTTAPYNFTWTPNSLGAYSLVVRATDSQGLTAKDSIRVQSTTSFSGGGTVSSFVGNGLTVYPNPTRDVTTLALAEVAAQSGLAKVQVFDLHGARVIAFERSLEPGDNEIPLDSRDFAAGNYLIEVTFQGQRYVGRLVKMN